MSQFAAWNYRLHQYLLTLQSRERWLMLTTWFVLMLGIGQALLWLSGFTNTQMAEQQTFQFKRQVELQSQLIAQLKSRQQQGEIERLTQTQQQLQRQVMILDEQIQVSSNFLIEPERMPDLLRQLLNRYSGLKLHSLNTVPIQTVDSVVTESMIYRHGLQVQVEGSFKTLASWLQEIESLSWVINWDRLEYQIGKWPTGQLTLEIHTLSTEEAWIGV